MRGCEKTPQQDKKGYITLPPLNESERAAWTDEELHTIWRAYDEEEVMAAYLLLMIYAGMMPGELMNARAKCCMWKNG